MSHDYDECCCICFDKLEQNNFTKLKCSHIIHFNCGMKWFVNHNTCPTCRQETGHNLSEITNEPENNIDLNLFNNNNMNLINLNRFTYPDFQEKIKTYNSLLVNKLFIEGIIDDMYDDNMDDNTELFMSLINDKWKCLHYQNEFNDKSSQELIEIWKKLSKKKRNNYFQYGLYKNIRNIKQITVEEMSDLICTHMLS